MNARFRMHSFMAEAGDQGGGAAAPAPAAAPTPAAPAPTPAPTPAPAAPAPSPAAPTPPPEPKGTWPDDWRTRVAKGDDKLLTRFSRYGSPEDVAAALISAQDRINRGELKPVLGKDATPEQIAEWRQAHGIPEAADKYDLSGDLGGGFKVSDKDKPIIDRILAVAHGSNQTPEQARANVRALYEIMDAAASRDLEKDKQDETKGVDVLRQEWGAEYRVNTNLIANLLAGTTAGDLQENLLNGRLADGTLIKNSPAVQKMLLSLALIENPLGTVVPGGGNPAQGIKEELQKIAEKRSKNRDAYNKDGAMQQRERDLINAAMKAGIMDDKGNWKQAA